MANLQRLAETKSATEAGVLRTIPSAFHDVAVTTSAATVDLSDPAGDGSVPSITGMYVYIQAITANITIMRSTQGAMTTATGLVIEAGTTPDEFYIAETGDPILTHIGDATGTLRIYYDTDLTRDTSD